MTDAPDDQSSPDAPAGVVVIGAGPAGLTAAYELGKRGRTATVLESDNIVGGISRTVERDGWRFDIGGHRFFTKVAEVEALWHEILPDGDFLLRPRKSRIFYKGKYFDYPLKAFNALSNLGPVEAVKCVGSYAMARIRPPKDQTNYEGWLVARFGWRLYRTFFKTYTEKVWGVPVSSMPADWAAQRVKNLSLSSAIINALLPKRNQKEIASLIEEFQYPKFGPGMMWERCTELVARARGAWRPVTKIATQRPGRERHRNPRRRVHRYPAAGHLLHADLAPLRPWTPVPAEVMAAALDLATDYMIVALALPESLVDFDKQDLHPQSQRAHHADQNFGSWSPTW